MKTHKKLWLQSLQSPFMVRDYVNALSLNQSQYNEVEENVNTYWGWMYGLLFIDLIVFVSIIIVYGSRTNEVTMYAYIALPVFVCTLYNTFVLHKISGALRDYATNHGLRNIDE